MKKISCIIATFNEGKRIGGVLSAIKNHPLVDEIIVINDGSTDSTEKIIRKNPSDKMIFISFKKNYGKSFAVATGIERAKNDYIFTLDSDLIGLTEKDVTNLIQPVIEDSADVSISLRKNALLIFRILDLDYVSGERVFPKNLVVRHINTIRKLPGFGLESFLNKLILQNSLRVKVVFWDNVISPRKSKKIGFLKGQIADLHMILQMLKVTSIREIFAMNRKLLRLVVK